jgi:quercetin dioxygenase-like cupin family protein
MTEPLHVRGSSLEWKSTRPGIGRIALGDDAATGAQTLLFKFEPGGFYPEHDHPTGEDI